MVRATWAPALACASSIATTFKSCAEMTPGGARRPQHNFREQVAADGRAPCAFAQAVQRLWAWQCLAGVLAKTLRRGLLAAAHLHSSREPGSPSNVASSARDRGGCGISFPEGPAAARSAVTDLEPQRPRSRSCLSRGLFVRLTQELLPKIVRDVSAVGQTTGKRSARLPRSTATDAACDPSGPRAKSLQGLHRPAWRPLFLSKQQRHAPTQSSRVDGGSGLIFRLLDREPRGDQPP
jgi:hypothetical protein